ncbi:metalloregulator ArsR/SmtB family transcription factor [Arthrobacter sp. H20]|uniref:ArsR/SmtB family transcription factor n=1 Tax=Arthrobacter sp. H20 TaxID=1267981 RepID=UPI00047A6E2B|nr:metalloregulator ArsR/SmtB family transcription factor [Arthrobacter sp. H20]
MVIEDVFAVVAEGTRREILGSLRSGDKAVGELVGELEVSQPTVSKHLKVLREAGLVSMRAQGQRRFYSLTPAPLHEIELWLGSFDLPAQAPLAPGLAVVAPHEESSLAAAVDPAADPAGQPAFGRTVGRAGQRAADLFAQLPKLRRRRD